MDVQILLLCRPAGQREGIPTGRGLLADAPGRPLAVCERDVRPARCLCTCGIRALIVRTLRRSWSITRYRTNQQTLERRFVELWTWPLLTFGCACVSR